MKKWISLITFFIFLLLSCTACTSQFSDETAKTTINSFLENRYDNVTISNIETRNKTSKIYYSTSFLDSDSPLLSHEQFAQGVDYYQKTGYTSTIVSSHTVASNNDKNNYTTHLAVLYFTNDHSNDSVVNYIFNFDVQIESGNYVFKHIEITGNEVLYIPNGEFHVSDGVAHVISDSCDHDH